MTVSHPDILIKNLYASFCYYLNDNGGQLRADEARYYKFLDDERAQHNQLVEAILKCKNLEPKCPNVLHLGKNVTGAEGGTFYLTYGKGDIVSKLDPMQMVHPPLGPDALMYGLITEEESQKIIASNPKKYKQVVEYMPKAVKEEPKIQKKQGDEWTKQDVIKLLTTQAHIVGRMLGHGYNKLEPIHSDWIREWLINPQNFMVMVHQAHRGSFKSTCLRLFCAILIILRPLETHLIIRKSEDAVTELTNGVSKILDTPLFHTFIGLLHPDIVAKGGFKKTTDTALAIDTNLNVSLSGEYQLRALGLGSPLTGKHAGRITTDDICTTDDRVSESIRNMTIMKYQEMMNLLSNNDGESEAVILNIGTPWHEEDVFSTMEHGLKDKTEEQKQIEALTCKERTSEQNERARKLNMRRGKFVYNCHQTGLMSEKAIAFKRKSLNDDTLFSANYLLSLVSDEEKPFPRINNLGKYSKSYFDDAWEVFAAIDAAYGGVDSCALGIGAFDWETNTTVVYGKIYDGIAIDKNYMDLAEIMFTCNVQKLFMESNTDKGLMGDKFRELGFIVESYHESTNKDKKIRSTISPFWREDGEACFPCVQFVGETDPAYLSQIHNYKRGVKKDDAPDNLACLLLRSKFGQLPIRIL